MASGIGDSPVRTYNSSSASSEHGFYKALFRLHDESVESCVPAIVKEYDRKKGTAKVQPILKTIIPTVNGEKLKDRPVYEVPVHRICRGGFTIDIPLFVGDTGWLISGDKPSDDARERNSKQNLHDLQDDDDGNEGPQRPDSFATACFAWGFFIPDFWGETDLGESEGIVIKYTNDTDGDGKPFAISASKSEISVSRGEEGADGSDKIAISDDGIKYIGKPDRVQKVLTDIKYDSVLHQIQAKSVEQSIRGSFVVDVSEESDWSMISGGQAVPEQEIE